MSAANDAVLAYLLAALDNVAEYNVPWELDGFWEQWLRDGHREAVEKGYDFG